MSDNLRGTMRGTVSYFGGTSLDSIATPETAILALQVYPNPAGEQLTVDGCPKDSPVKVWDSEGRCVHHANLTYGALSTEGLSSGVYTLEVFDRAKRLRFVKQ